MKRKRHPPGIPGCPKTRTEARKGRIAGIVIIVVIALLFVGYNIYRYPARFRSLSDNSLNDSQVEELVENMEEYDIVFVGYPVWWHATPAPINTFLESYDLTGKLIIPFCTSGGSDIDETMPTFLNSCDGLAVYGEKRISGTSQIDGGCRNWD